MAKKKLSQTEKTVNRLYLYQRVFGNPDGQEVLKDLIGTHSLLSSTYKDNVNEMLLKEGERNVVLRILSILKTNPAQFLERLKEYERE